MACRRVLYQVTLPNRCCTRRRSSLARRAMPSLAALVRRVSTDALDLQDNVDLVGARGLRDMA